MLKFGYSSSCFVSALFLCLLLADCVKGQCQQPSLKPGFDLTDESAGLDSFGEGTTVTLQCGIGYSKVSGSGEIVCQNGEWTAETLQCQKKSCGSPGELLNGKFSTPDGIEFGATAFASCNRGYKLLGTAYRQCFDFGWNNRVPTCEIVKCQDPPTIDNGKISSQPAKEFPEFRDVIQYTCDRNFNLVGDKEIVCNEFGTYNGTTPRCTAEELCPTPVIQNAVRVGGGPPPYKLNYFVEYKCNDGYVMNGSSVLRCEATGWSAAFPTCNKVVYCPTPAIENTVRTEGGPPPYKLNDVVVYQCKDGYVMSGSSRLVCEESGWSSAFPTCNKVVYCPTPAIENAVRTEGGPPPYKLNDVVVYQCKDGYVMSGSSRLVCEESGWSFAFPTCNKVVPPVTTTATTTTTTSKPKIPDGEVNTTAIIIGVVVALVVLVAAALCCYKIKSNKDKGSWGYSGQVTRVAPKEGDQNERPCHACEYITGEDEQKLDGNGVIPSPRANTHTNSDL